MDAGVKRKPQYMCGRADCGLSGADFRVCSRCRVPRYCSPSCQKLHWKQSHKRDCARLQGLEAKEKATPGTASINGKEAKAEVLGDVSANRRIVSRMARLVREALQEGDFPPALLYHPQAKKVSTGRLLLFGYTGPASPLPAKGDLVKWMGLACHRLAKLQAKPGNEELCIVSKIDELVYCTLVPVTADQIKRGVNVECSSWAEKHGKQMNVEVGILR